MKYEIEQTLEEKIYLAQCKNPATFTKKEIYNIINRLVSYNYKDTYTGILNPMMIEIIMNNKPEILRLILDGTDVNQLCVYGITPLILAIYCNNYDVARILIEHGASINIKYSRGLSPLLFACYMHNDDIIKMLLENGANINDLDNSNYNTLQYLIIGGKESPTKLNADIFSFPVINKSFPHYFIQSEKTELESIIMSIDLLVENGIDINYRNHINNDETSLSFAMECRGKTYTKVIEKLIELGASKEVVEIYPHYVFEYQDYFDLSFLVDPSILPELKGFPKAYFYYLEYIMRIKKYGINVISDSRNEHYKKSRLIKHN